jgi:hypothetical protein
VASSRNVPVPIELKRGKIKVTKIEIISWANKYWPSGICHKNERNTFGCKTSEMLELRILAKVKIIKDKLEMTQIKLVIEASFRNSKFDSVTLPFTSSVKKVIASKAPTTKKLLVIEVNLKTVNKLLIKD